MIRETSFFGPIHRAWPPTPAGPGTAPARQAEGAVAAKALVCAGRR